MVLRLNHQPEIEDLRNHSAETVAKLRQLLAAGVPAVPDPHRNSFFEVENGMRVFYIHISPVSGKVMLLATWLKEAQPASYVSAHHAA